MSVVSHILPQSPCWMDRRLSNVYYNEFAYSAEPPKDLAEWRDRRDFTRAQVSMAAGLAPMPEKTPLKPEVWGHTRHEGTVIAKVRFESMPGLQVTGNLYMPERVRDQAPGILCPHGHWSVGRINDTDLGSIPKRCMMLARLGFIVLSYDMVGYNDNNKILHSWPTEIAREAGLYGVSTFGLQTWNSLRALDFLCGLPDVDERRIGCTGASGGASQTWTISLLDERIKVIAPVCMLSSHFQGGCACEEGPLLRLNGVTSFDVLCACAPRPLLLPAVTQDWTNLNPIYEIPALRKVYELFNAGDALRSFQLDAPHNYNKDTRERVYPWFTHWLLNQSLRETIAEDALEMPPLDVFLHSDKQEKPTEATTKERITLISGHVCKSALPDIKGVAKPDQFRQQRVALVGDIVNYDQHLKDVAVRVTYATSEITGARVQSCIISRRDVGDIIPAYRIDNAKPDAEKPCCLLLGDGGKADFFNGKLNNILELLVANGCNCLIPDLMGSGESTAMIDKSPRDENDALFFAFNPSIFSMRVQDILTCLQLIREAGHSKIALIACGASVKPALAALAIGERLASAVLDFTSQGDADSDWLPLLDYQPMIRKIGGMTGLSALANTDHLGIHKPEDKLAEYVGAFSETLKTPLKLTVGRDTFLRLVEYVVCKYKPNA